LKKTLKSATLLKKSPFLLSFTKTICHARKVGKNCFFKEANILKMEKLILEKRLNWL